jgi:hypothetical protein
VPEAFTPEDVAKGGLLVAAPMGVEAKLIRKGAPNATVRRIGIGPKRAQEAGERLAALLGEDAGVTVAVVGFGGGLDREVRVGEVVVASELLAEAEEPLRLPHAERIAAALAKGGVKARVAPVFCARRPVVGGGRQRVRAQTGALVAEMESIWFARELPLLPIVVRVVSDGPGGEGPRVIAALRGFLEAREALRHAARALAGAVAGAGADIR